MSPEERYMTMTMCHCQDPDDCFDHWSVGIPLRGYDPVSGQISVATDMSGAFRTREDAQLFADAKNRSLHNA